MENDDKRRIASKRSVKFQKLAKSLEEERQAILKEQLNKNRELNRQIPESKNSDYDESIHRIVADIEREAEFTKNSEDAAIEEETILEDVKQLKKKFTVKTILFLVGILLLFFGVTIVLLKKSLGTETSASEEAILESQANHMDPQLRTMWLSNKEINEDYVGQIVFDSGLVDLSFVQAKDVFKEDGSLHVFYDKNGNLIEDPSGYTGNDVYIWTNWKTGKYDRYEEGGSVFMDYRNYLKDQNIIIYGHHYARDYDPSGTKQFTPLDLLLSEENYDDNKELSLILDNEIRRYIVTNVFTIDISDEYERQIIRTDLNYDLSGNYEPKFFKEFIGYLNKISRYDSGVILSDSDRILTLITCLEHQPEYRQVIMCKEVSDDIYDPS